MRTKQPAKIPVALSAASQRFNQWRSRHRKRTRLPKELWRQAAALAGEQGLTKTARALGLDYYSLKKHLEQMTAEELIPAKGEANFIELLGGAMTLSLIECTIEWTDGGDSMVRMHIKGAGLSELASLAGVFRGSQA